MTRSRSGELQAAWDALFDGLLEQRAAMGRRVREAMQAELPTYASLPAEQLDPDVSSEVERVIRCSRAGSAAVSKEELAELAAIGELRAQQGVPVDDMLRAWRIGVQVVVAHAREVARRLDIGNEQVLEFVEATLAWCDVAMVTTAGAHRRMELELASADQKERTAFVRDALFGALGPTELRVRAETFALDPAGDYVAVRARRHVGGTVHELERALGFHDAAQHRRGLSTVIDGDVAGFLREPPEGDLAGIAGVGPPRSLDRLAESFRLATRALVAASAFGAPGAHDLHSLGLRAAVGTDADVGEVMCARYLDPLPTGGSSKELAATLREYLACEMHVERTAERLFVHQNTVRYRLARFEELTGANLREPEVAFGVWWALEHSARVL